MIIIIMIICIMLCIITMSVEGGGLEEHKPPEGELDTIAEVTLARPVDGLIRLECLAGNHWSITTCLTHVFFNKDE